MKINKLNGILAAGLAASFAVSSAHAMTVQPSTSSTFGTISASPETTLRTKSTTAFAALAWQDADCVTCNSARSRIRFNDLGPAARANNGQTGLGEPIALGQLRFKNLTGPGTPGLESAQLSLSIQLWDSMLEPVDLIFSMTVSEASSSARNRNRTVSADQITLSLPSSSYTFTTPEGSFKLDILGWSRDRGTTFTDSLRVSDNAMGGMMLYGMVQQLSTGPVVSQVPVPAAAWLFGSGLLALTGIARRRA